jgi:hypothetical protein
VRFEAFWIPGLNTDFDPDRALSIGFRWLDDASYGRRRVVVLNAANMLGNRPALARAADRYSVVSPRTRDQPRGRGNAILAVWPTMQTLALAEGFASEGGLCVIPDSLDDVTVWVSRTRAVNLADPKSGPAAPLALGWDVTNVLNSLLGFDGHNGFYGAGGKEQAVRDLRAMIAADHRPKPDEVEAYAIASGETHHRGAAHLREIYEGVLAGRRFRDSGGRVI